MPDSVTVYNTPVSTSLDQFELGVFAQDSWTLTRRLTINAGLRRLGYSTDEMTAHGFRAMASTLLNESGKWHPDAIERALAHGDSDRVRAAYHRGAHWKERVAMAQWWSDHLDQLRKGAEVVPIKAGKR